MYETRPHYTMDRFFCRHKLKSKTRPGQACGQSSEVDLTTRFHFGYCYQHKKSHREDWIDELEEAQRNYQESEHKLQLQRQEEIKVARIPNAATIEGNAQFGRPVPDEYYKEQPNKTEPTIEECINHILNTAQMEIFAHRNNVTPLSIFTLFPCQWRGWPAEEIAHELQNRVYDTRIYARELTFRARWNGTQQLHLHVDFGTG